MVKFLGGPHDGEQRDIHKNTEEWMFEDGNVRYYRSRLENGDEVFLFDPHHQRNVKQAKAREAGEAFDQRMQELLRDTPSPTGSDNKRRKRR